VSGAADAAAGPALPQAWDRLEAAARQAVLSLEAWRRRACDAEDEVVRLRQALEEAASEPVAPKDARVQLRRLRAENAALRSRLGQAQRRVGALLEWTDVFGEDP
jgi:hypothetical protein